MVPPNGGGGSWPVLHAVAPFDRDDAWPPDYVANLIRTYMHPRPCEVRVASSAGLYFWRVSGHADGERRGLDRIGG